MPSSSESSTGSFVTGRELKHAVAIYMREAYKGACAPQAVQERIAKVEGFSNDQTVPLDWLEKSQCDSGRCTYALRLGQPAYPHMKLVMEESPDGGHPLFRADSHDGMLHAAHGSPDAAALCALRAANKDLTDRIEAGWIADGLPTFKQYLRTQLAQRKRRCGDDALGVKPC